MTKTEPSNRINKTMTMNEKPMTITTIDDASNATSKAFGRTDTCHPCGKALTAPSWPLVGQVR